MMHRAILLAAACLVPAEQREAWLAEWIAELWQVQRSRDPGCGMRFCLGSFQDAFFLRRDNPRTALLLFQSPQHCLAFLAALACATLSMALMTEAGRSLILLSHGPGGCYGVDCMPAGDARGLALAAPLLAILLSCVVLPTTTGISLGQMGSGPGRYRRWLFLGAKVALVLLTMLGLSLKAAQLHDPRFFVPLTWVVEFGGISVFRWVLLDQRGRCPVCLRLLEKPIDLGQASRCLIDWERTELLCLRGHGFLHVPGLTASWRGTQEWHRLDASWADLFKAVH